MGGHSLASCVVRRWSWPSALPPSCLRPAPAGPRGPVSAACKPPACSSRATPRPRSPAAFRSPGRPPAAGMPAGLRAAGPGRWGRPSRLTDRDWRRVERALLAGAEAHGFDTDLWTLPRVAEVIWRLRGVSYHPGHVWWLLRRHQWSPQRPARRASERDEAEIARWRAEEWPRIKKGRQSKARGAALSTSPARH